MSAPTLLALSQRDEAFWLGLALLLVGAALTSGAPTSGEWDGGDLLLTLGWLVLSTRLAVAAFRIVRTTVRAGLLGYREGASGER
ncbi:hypothetical protein [Halomarina ordinaria]|uniref:Uncharacterized protein n=1 Tax=Halomarina ordinaria TaxID=3033939 RepID=A0ABD5UCY6_9EURY|nr:hypothetical protein [Halomarina sp. PSRA2]